MRRTPLRPASAWSQNASTPTPSAEMAPMPVIATRLISGGSGALGSEAAQTVDDLADGLHRIGGAVGDGHAERVFEGEEEIGGVERVDAEIAERALARNRRGIQLLFSRDDRDDLTFDLV